MKPTKWYRMDPKAEGTPEMAEMPATPEMPATVGCWGHVTHVKVWKPASIIYSSRILCLSFVLSYSFLSSCHICGTLSYSLCLRILSYIYLGSSVCLSSCHIPVILSSCHICGTLSYSLCLRIQTDRVDETEGFEREGLQMER
jgi:hypothetical protein